MQRDLQETCGSHQVYHLLAVELGRLDLWSTQICQWGELCIRLSVFCHRILEGSTIPENSLAAIACNPFNECLDLFLVLSGRRYAPPEMLTKAPGSSFLK